MKCFVKLTLNNCLDTHTYRVAFASALTVTGRHEVDDWPLTPCQIFNNPKTLPTINLLYCSQKRKFLCIFLIV